MTEGLLHYLGDNRKGAKATLKYSRFTFGPHDSEEAVAVEIELEDHPHEASGTISLGYRIVMRDDEVKALTIALSKYLDSRPDGA